MHFESKILCFIILCNLVSSENENNVQDDIQMCDFGKEISLPAKYFSIKIRNNETISWSPCVLYSQKPICPQNSLICLNNVDNLGSSFQLVNGPFSSKYCLQSQHGHTCRANRTRKYVVYILFNEYSFEPHLLPSSDECEFHIAVPDPKAEFPCTKRVKGHLIDFRLFTDDFTVKDGNDTYIFNLCSSANGCNSNQISSCVVGSQQMSFGDISKRFINYNEQDGVVRFQFKFGGSSTKVDLNCNWNTVFGKPRYLKSSSNKMKKFVLDSSLGCVKLPMDCKIVDLANYEYDLSGLHKKNGNWKVKNSQNRSIEINICGQLQNSRKICKDQHSQVCEALAEKGTYVNYGSILVEKGTKGDNLRARLVHGSVCPENNSLIMSTDLTFKCSLQEKGPILFNSTDCGLDILWETPEACPTNVKVERELSMYDNLGRRNLKSLCDSGDRTHKINGSCYITYNLCAPLKEPCNKIMSVSACLHANEKETVLGYYSDDKLISNDGILSMEFFGEPCKNFNVYFVCAYGVTKSAEVELQIIHDNCVYKMDIKTSEACASKPNSHPEKYCSVKNGTFFYNFTSLALTSSNYKVTDGKNDIEYIINICNPVVTGPGALCKGSGTNICVYNRTEPNIKHRFNSIGTQTNLPKIEGDKIALEFDAGYLCRKMKLASGIIYLKCSNKDFGPKFIEEENCFYKFSWETPHACPKKMTALPPCLVPYQNDFLDMEAVESKEIRIPYLDKTNFIFNICSDNYTRIYKGKNETLRARREADEKSLTFQLNNVCNSNENADIWNKISVIFSCGEDGQDIFQFVSIQNCTAYVKCNTKSRKFCKQVDKPVASGIDNFFNIAAERLSSFKKTINSITETKEAPTKIERHVEIKANRTERKDAPTQTERHVKLKENQADAPSFTTTPNKMVLSICTITIGEEEIVLNHLPPITLISHSGSRYSIGLRDSSQCNGYICKENLTISTLSVCPRAYTEDSELKVIFNDTKSPAGPFIVTMTFKCNFTMEYPRINAENDNSLGVIYPVDRICPKSPTNSGVIAGIVIVVVIIIVIVSFVAIRSYKKKYWILGQREDKSNLYLYARNSED